MLWKHDAFTLIFELLKVRRITQALRAYLFDFRKLNTYYFPTYRYGKAGKHSQLHKKPSEEVGKLLDIPLEGYRI